MSGPINDGGPAFPVTEGALLKHPGMSLRDYFAGQALAGIKANYELGIICSKVPKMTQPEAIAIMAYKDADAMLAERKKRAGQ